MAVVLVHLAIRNLNWISGQIHLNQKEGHPKITFRKNNLQLLEKIPDNGFK